MFVLKTLFVFTNQRKNTKNSDIYIWPTTTCVLFFLIKYIFGPYFFNNFFVFLSCTINEVNFVGTIYQDIPVMKELGHGAKHFKIL